MWLYYFAKAICMIAFNIWYKLDYHGLENIPSGGGYILMSNHRSMIDPIILAEKAHGQVRYMGKMELFRNPILGWALRTIGTFPVDLSRTMSWRYLSLWIYSEPTMSEASLITSSGNPIFLAISMAKEEPGRPMANWKSAFIS